MDWLDLARSRLRQGRRHGTQLRKIIAGAKLTHVTTTTASSLRTEKPWHGCKSLINGWHIFTGSGKTPRYTMKLAGKWVDLISVSFLRIFMDQQKCGARRFTDTCLPEAKSRPSTSAQAFLLLLRYLSSHCSQKVNTSNDEPQHSRHLSGGILFRPDDVF